MSKELITSYRGWQIWRHSPTDLYALYDMGLDPWDDIQPFAFFTTQEEAERTVDSIAALYVSDLTNTND